MHDPAMFPEPDTFRPERFLETHDPRLLDFDLPFGFGRRICVGLHLARASLFITVSRILWAFDILPAVDETGREVLPDVNNFTNGFNSRPVSFDCRLVPRNERIKDTIRGEAAGAQEKLAGWAW